MSLRRNVAWPALRDESKGSWQTISTRQKPWTRRGNSGFGHSIDDTLWPCSVISSSTTLISFAPSLVHCSSSHAIDPSSLQLLTRNRPCRPALGILLIPSRESDLSPEDDVICRFFSDMCQNHSSRLIQERGEE